jgi:hypothetical protein
MPDRSSITFRRNAPRSSEITAVFLVLQLLLKPVCTSTALYTSDICTHSLVKAVNSFHLQFCHVICWCFICDEERTELWLIPTRSIIIKVKATSCIQTSQQGTLFKPSNTVDSSICSGVVIVQVMYGRMRYGRMA